MAATYLSKRQIRSRSHFEINNVDSQAPVVSGTDPRPSNLRSGSDALVVGRLPSFRLGNRVPDDK